MPKAYSLDLRERVARFVDSGPSRHAAAINERTFVFRRMHRRGQRRICCRCYVTIRPSAPARSRNRAGPWRGQ
jgi:hypothetical protein